mgnify:CR=1 FL=1
MTIRRSVSYCCVKSLSEICSYFTVRNICKCSAKFRDVPSGFLSSRKECSDAEFIDELPIEFRSVHGVGRNEPDPLNTMVLEDGVKVPLGLTIPSRHEHNRLKYNEYPLVIMYITCSNEYVRRRCSVT